MFSSYGNSFQGDCGTFVFVLGPPFSLRVPLRSDGLRFSALLTAVLLPHYTEHAVKFTLGQSLEAKGRGEGSAWQILQ